MSYSANSEVALHFVNSNGVIPVLASVVTAHPALIETSVAAGAVARMTSVNVSECTHAAQCLHTVTDDNAEAAAQLTQLGDDISKFLAIISDLSVTNTDATLLRVALGGA